MPFPHQRRSSGARSVYCQGQCLRRVIGDPMSVLPHTSQRQQRTKSTLSYMRSPTMRKSPGRHLITTQSRMRRIFTSCLLRHGCRLNSRFFTDGKLSHHIGALPPILRANGMRSCPRSRSMSSSCRLGQYVPEMAIRTSRKLTSTILGTPSICDLVLNIAYFPEISGFFERLSVQVPFQEVLRVTFVPCTHSLFMCHDSHERVNELY